MILPTKLPKRILFRIIGPFTLLFTFTTLITWLLSSSFISRSLDYNLQEQLNRVASVLSQSSFLLNPAILAHMKKVVKGEIILLDAKGTILRSTLNAPTLQNKISDLMKKSATDRNRQGMDTSFQQKRYRTAIQPLSIPEHGAGYLLLWQTKEESSRLNRLIVLVIGGSGLTGIIAMTILGFFITRSITSPIEELVQVSQEVAEGDFSKQAQVNTNDEVGQLAASFNFMITKLKDYERQLLQTGKLAAAGQMAASLAHEIRNPLTSIKMFVQVLQNRLKEQPENRKMVVSLLSEIERLERIVQQIVDRARPGELHKKWINVNSVLDEVLVLASQTLKNHHIKLETSYDVQNITAFVDEEKIKQIFWNLLLNNKDAMPKGGKLQINTSVHDEEKIVITFTDEGKGFDDADQENIFQPFFSTKPEGMGLGLSTSRKIAAQHGGALHLVNQNSGGVKAILELPIDMKTVTKI